MAKYWHIGIWIKQGYAALMLAKFYTVLDIILWHAQDLVIWIKQGYALHILNIYMQLLISYCDLHEIISIIFCLLYIYYRLFPFLSLIRFPPHWHGYFSSMVGAGCDPHLCISKTFELMNIYILQGSCWSNRWCKVTSNWESVFLCGPPLHTLRFWSTIYN